MDEDEYGPGMRALTEKQRRFVLAMAADPFATQSSWAEAAGYEGGPDCWKVAACNLLKNPRVEVAVYEVGRAYLGTVGPILAAAGLIKIAQNERHPKHFAALTAIADRVGLPAASEHHVAVHHTDMTGRGLVERIKALAADLGLDPARLLGGNAVSRESNVIEGKVVGEERG